MTLRPPPLCSASSNVATGTAPTARSSSDASNERERAAPALVGDRAASAIAHGVLQAGVGDPVAGHELAPRVLAGERQRQLLAGHPQPARRAVERRQADPLEQPAARAHAAPRPTSARTGRRPRAAGSRRRRAPDRRPRPPPTRRRRVPPPQGRRGACRPTGAAPLTAIGTSASSASAAAIRNTPLNACVAALSSSPVELLLQLGVRRLRLRRRRHLRERGRQVRNPPAGRADLLGDRVAELDLRRRRQRRLEDQRRAGPAPPPAADRAAPR